MPGLRSTNDIARIVGRLIWIVVVFGISIAAFRWLLAEPPRNMTLSAVCEELALGTPARLTWNTAESLHAYGFRAFIERIGDLRVVDADTSEPVPLSPSTSSLTLDYKGGAAPPAVAIKLIPETGRVTIGLSDDAVIGLQQGTEPNLIFSAATLMAETEAEGLSVTANRLSNAATQGHPHLNIEIHNARLMAKISLRSIEGSNTQLSVNAKGNVPIETMLRSADRGGTSHLKGCSKLDLMLDNEKSSVPEMVLSEISVAWNSLAINKIAVQTKSTEEQSRLLIGATGIATSVTYGDKANPKELNRTRLADLIALSGASLTGITILLLIAGWLSKKLLDRIVDVVLERLLPKKTESGK